MSSQIMRGGRRFPSPGFKITLALLSFLALVGLGAAAAVPAQAGSDASAGADAGSPAVSAHRMAPQTATGTLSDTSTLPVNLPNGAAANPPPEMPLLPSGRLTRSARLEELLSHNPSAPVASASEFEPGGPTAAPNSISTSWNGLFDSATTCPFFRGCQPPDGALAAGVVAGNTYVVEGVNTSFVVYGGGGAVKHGPWNAATFFGVPHPPGCPTALPFTSDPRAFYDQNDHKFWVAMLEVEGAFGINSSCGFLSKYWVAVYNPATNTKCVYNFNMSLDNTSAADFTQFGYSKDTIAFTANMYDSTGNNFLYAEAVFADKASMEGCNPVTATGFDHLKASSTLVDTVQPVKTITTVANDPGVEYLINTFNANGDTFGHDCVLAACHGVVIWAYKPSSKTITGFLLNSAVNYVQPPNADDLGCIKCLETLDTRISGQPVYGVMNGKGWITFANETGMNNGTQTVPAVQWNQVHPVLSSGAITGASLGQHNKITFGGDRAASFGSPGIDLAGNLAIVFYSMSKTLTPSAFVRDRTVSDTPSTLRGSVLFAPGVFGTQDTRWGDYSATSFDGTRVWIYGEYANGSFDWSTRIAKLKIP